MMGRFRSPDTTASYFGLPQKQSTNNAEQIPENDLFDAFLELSFSLPK